jgi:hypothetical protein
LARRSSSSAGERSCRTTRRPQARVYDTEQNQWTILNSIPFDRLGPVGGIYNGRVFITNGYSRQQGMATESYWGDLEGFDVV